MSASHLIARLIIEGFHLTKVKYVKSTPLKTLKISTAATFLPFKVQPADYQRLIYSLVKCYMSHLIAPWICNCQSDCVE